MYVISVSKQCSNIQGERVLPREKLICNIRLAFITYSKCFRDPTRDFEYHEKRSSKHIQIKARTNITTYLTFYKTLITHTYIFSTYAILGARVII